MAVDEIQYSTSKQWTTAADDANIVGEIDKIRIAAYNLYDGMFHNRQESLKIQVRGDNQLPIYMPSAKKIVEATSRYLMVGFDYFSKGPMDTADNEDDNLDVPVNADTAQAATTVEGYFASFFKREKVKSKFTNQKRYNLVRGDCMWYLTADPNKRQGERLSLHELDPRQYFPIDDPKDNTRIIGCHIVDTCQDPTKPDDKSALVARRQTYLKVYDEKNVLLGISSERTCWELGTWDDRILEPDKMKKVANPAQDLPYQMLPKQITSLPVYHIKNNALPNAGFGMSELAGMESLIFAINQSITDEDLTLIMQGLGMYVTNAAPPTNNDNTPGDWNVGPGVVIELGTDQEFTRVTGVTTTAPYTEHMEKLDGALAEGSGTPDIAIGTVDVTIAESGIALMLKMSPILAKNAEKEIEWILVHDQMFYDMVTMWLPAYEGIDPGVNQVLTIVDDPMPVNRDAKVQELILLYTSGVISLAMVVSGLMELGYQFPSNDPQEAADMISAEQKQKSIDMMGDPYANGDAGTGDSSFGGGNQPPNDQISAGVT